MFNTFDKDGDGSLDSVELRNGMHKIGLDFSDNDFEKLRDHCDKDGDGSISLLELEETLKKATNITDRERIIFSFEGEEDLERELQMYEAMKEGWTKDPEDVITLTKLTSRKMHFPRVSSTSRDTAPGDAFWLSKSPTPEFKSIPRVGTSGSMRGSKRFASNTERLAVSPKSSLYVPPDHAKSLPNLSSMRSKPPLPGRMSSPISQSSVLSMRSSFGSSYTDDDDHESVLSSDEEEYQEKRRQRRKQKQRLPNALRRAQRTYTIDSDRRKQKS